MKTNELITKIRSVMHMVAPPAQELLEQAADALEGFVTAEENGTILRLPCPIGSKIHILARRKNGGGHIYTQTLVGVHLRDEHSRRCLRRKEYIVVRGGEGFSNHLDMDKQGVVWFTDYGAAKTALDALPEPPKEAHP